MGEEGKRRKGREGGEGEGEGKEEKELGEGGVAWLTASPSSTCPRSPVGLDPVFSSAMDRLCALESDTFLCSHLQLTDALLLDVVIGMNFTSDQYDSLMFGNTPSYSRSALKPIMGLTRDRV
jgi:hypothetical protein